MKAQFKRIINYSLLFINCCSLNAQLKWVKVDSLYQPLPSSVHVYFTNEPIDTGAFRAYYLIADLKDKKLSFDVDTTKNRRLTPRQFYTKSCDEHPNNACYFPLVVVNTTFFSFQTNQNLNVVIKDGKLVGYNIHSILGRGKDTLTYRHPFGSAIGISKKREADVAWTFTDSSIKYSYAKQYNSRVLQDSLNTISFSTIKIWRQSTKLLPTGNPTRRDLRGGKRSFHKWKMKTAVGGGPVLVRNGSLEITNNDELKFAGKAINDKHPRTAMGYTKDGKLIILVVQGRSESGGGATLPQEAQILKDLGCWEALNLDGGGSSCLLINGKETIKPSDPTGQRAVPAVFLITSR